MDSSKQFPLGGEREFEATDSTVYQLMHHGWRKGEEQFRNRIWLSVNVDRESSLDREQVTVHVAKVLNSHDQLVAALQMALEIGDDCSRGFLGEFQAAARAALAAAGA